MRARWNPALEQRPASLQYNAEERRMPDQVGDDEEVRKETRRWRFRAHAIAGRCGSRCRARPSGWRAATAASAPRPAGWSLITRTTAASRSKARLRATCGATG